MRLKMRRDELVDGAWYVVRGNDGIIVMCGKYKNHNGGGSQSIGSSLIIDLIMDDCEWAEIDPNLAFSNFDNPEKTIEDMPCFKCGNPMEIGQINYKCQCECVTQIGGDKNIASWVPGLWTEK